MSSIVRPIAKISDQKIDICHSPNVRARSITLDSDTTNGVVASGAQHSFHLVIDSFTKNIEEHKIPSNQLRRYLFRLSHSFISIILTLQAKCPNKRFLMTNLVVFMLYAKLLRCVVGVKDGGQ